MEGPWAPVQALLVPLLAAADAPAVHVGGQRVTPAACGLAEAFEALGLSALDSGPVLEALGLHGVTVHERHAVRLPLAALQDGSKAFYETLKTAAAAANHPAGTPAPLVVGDAVKDAPLCRGPTIINGASVFLFTGQPAACSLAAPLTLDVRADGQPADTDDDDDDGDGDPLTSPSSPTPRHPDAALLARALRRLLARAAISHHLSRIVACAASPDAAYAACFRRTALRPGAPAQQLHIFRVPPEALDRIWSAETQLAANDPERHLTRDGPLLAGALDALGIPASLCAVRCAGSSLHRVYLVTFPTVHMHRSRRCLGVAADLAAASLALKVLRITAAFQQEASLLQRIAANAAGDRSLGDRGFYAMGCFHPHRSDRLTLFRHLPVAAPPPELLPDPERRGWWRPTLVPGAGGVILMEAGRPLGSATPADLWAAGCQSLQHAHANAVLHCDVRRPNFVRFPSGIQLVDFGCGVPVDRPTVSLDGEGEQSCGAGVRLKGRIGAVEWTVADDYQMLAEAVFFSTPPPHAPAPPPPTSPSPSPDPS